MNLSACIACGLDVEHGTLRTFWGTFEPFPGPHIAPCGLPCGAYAGDRGLQGRAHLKPGGCPICGELRAHPRRRRRGRI